MVSVRVMLLLVFVVSGPCSLHANDPAELEMLHGKRIIASRVEYAPVLDGVLNDSLWQRARPVVDFLQKEPNAGAQPNERTEVRFLYDDDALYIGARMYSDKPEAIVSTVSRRDKAGNSHRFIVSLDTYNDKLTAYSFGVTADGVRVDYYHPTDEEYNRDYSYDPVWQARTNRDSLGWTAEMRIPFSQLRFSDAAAQQWGINMNRWISARNEDIYWVSIPKDVVGWSSRFGALEGISGVAPSSRIEILPYVAADVNLPANINPDDPFAEASEFGARAGADIKMGLGPNLTLDATIYPDFGQVEADPAEVNLTAFETFFDERRPFFVEGAALLSGSGPSYFYSRRIGAVPHGAGDGDFVDAPRQTDILGALKLSGRLQNGLSIGVLTALTAREYAEVYHTASGTATEQLVEALASYSVARVQQEFGENASSVGLMLTSVMRDLPAESDLGGIVNREAYSGGADWNVRFGKGDYELRGHLGFSTISGSTTAILRAQTSSARYYQRPDAEHVDVDSARNSLSGYTAALKFSKNSGEHWLWGISYWMETPGFELNDLGSLASADDISQTLWLTWRETEPGSFYHSYSARLQNKLDWNWAGELLFNTWNANLGYTWKNFWSSNVNFNYITEGQSDVLTRGGPLMRFPANWDLDLDMSSNFAASTTWDVGLLFGGDDIGSRRTEVDFTLATRFGGRWECSLSADYEHREDARQYIATLAGGPAAAYGRRYVFARIERSTIALQLRINYALTPDISLELYMEPFVASGAFSRFGELKAARSSDLLEYGAENTAITQVEPGVYSVRQGNENFRIERPDFLVHSIRSNAVLRWEWLPGSTLFLVWQTNGSDVEQPGAGIGAADVGDALALRRDNLLALKVSYWLPVN